MPPRSSSVSIISVTRNHGIYGFNTLFSLAVHGNLPFNILMSAFSTTKNERRLACLVHAFKIDGACVCRDVLQMVTFEFDHIMYCVRNYASKRIIIAS